MSARKETPTTRSTDRLQDEGYLTEVVEKKERHAGGKTRDLFGFIDILGVHPEKRRTIGVQATTDDHISHRRRKILDDPELRGRLYRLLAAGWHFEIHGWREDGTVKIERIRIEQAEGQTTRERLLRMATTEEDRRKIAGSNL